MVRQACSERDIFVFERKQLLKAMEWNRTNTERNQQPINVLIKSFASLFIGLWFCKGNRLWPKRQKKADGMKLASDGAEM